METQRIENALAIPRPYESQSPSNPVDVTFEVQQFALSFTLISCIFVPFFTSSAGPQRSTLTLPIDFEWILIG